jgi:TPR repeat protein
MDKPGERDWEKKQREYEVKKARAKALKLRLTCSICSEKAKLNCPCGTTQYCSTECQRIDWRDRGHRKACKKIRDERAAEAARAEAPSPPPSPPVYGPAPRSQADEIRARIAAEHEAARALREANPERKPTSARWGSRCPICFDDWDVNEPVTRVAHCCCRRVCESCFQKCGHQPCPLCRSPPLLTDAAKLAALRRHVENDVPEAIWYLGLVYRDGHFGLQVNEKKAMKIFKRAVERGSVAAMSDLGVMYVQGLGGKRDFMVGFKKSEQLYRMAADRGCYSGQHNLANLMKSKGDYDKSMFYYELSAKQGNAQATRALESLKLAPKPPTDVKLRFGLGARVECSMPDGWFPGEVVALWYHEDAFPEGFIAPYQVDMDNGSLIYARIDDDTTIRAQLRFAIGEKVEYCLQETWYPGTVIGHRIPRHLRGYPIMKEMAYQVLRDDDEAYYAPEDDDQYIRAPLPVPRRRPRVGPDVAERTGAFNGVP